MQTMILYAGALTSAAVIGHAAADYISGMLWRVVALFPGAY